MLGLLWRLIVGTVHAHTWEPFGPPQPRSRIVEINYRDTVVKSPDDQPCRCTKCGVIKTFEL